MTETSSGFRVQDAGAARAYLDLARPFTLVAPALGFISGALTAIGAAPREPWTASLLVPPPVGSVMAALLNAGVNDLGGVLMNESISRAAGAAHGQETTVADLERAAASAGRPLAQRTTLYRQVAPRAAAIAAE